ncbi:MAG: aspartate kinase [Cyanobacteria bacterium]|nr:aspartate kinase [Cyanobacteriota bacterium]MDW8202128.1 aspartate kinase [Cyanobacteriota bacterium SKYGB_h_bin112]
MALIVQKYGGSSVGSIERIQAVAGRVVRTVNAGHRVVVVVSAMGKTTDSLVKLARELSNNPSRREMDVLLSTGEQVSIALMSIALQELGQPAISLTGAQVGIVTEAEHTRARILSIETDRLQYHLDQGQVVVVAGFQGVTDTTTMEVTTLGRGGSDTSAVALAAALKADCCEIYTDVPGILTTDPRLVPEAQLMSEITCDEMLELASLGAKVLHPRAVEIARNFGVPLVVRSSWSDDPGTRVLAPSLPPRSLQTLELSRPVDGVVCDRNQAKVALLRVPDRPGIAARLFSEIARHSLDVDLIIQSIHDGNTNDIAFTVTKDSLTQAEAIAHAFLASIDPSAGTPVSTLDAVVDADVAKISIIGAGMIGRPGVAAHMFSTLAAAGINIQMISTSEVQVSCVVAIQDCDRATTALRQAFDLDNSLPMPVLTNPNSAPNDPNDSAAATPLIRGVALDRQQAKLAIRQVPDRPGMAARLFQLLADKGISVDMIIQSQRCRIVNNIPTRDIAFTVALGDADDAHAALSAAAPDLEWGEIVIDRNVAKVSVVGSTMIGQPGVAARMFTALAEQQINIQMIATSEIKISCIIAADQGVTALQAIHSAFGLSGTQTIQVAAP